MNINNSVIFLEKQNAQLLKNIRSIEDNTTTNNQKINYIDQNIHTYKQINYYLFILYYIFVIMVAYKLFSAKTSNVYSNIFYLLGFGIFPYVIYPIELKMYEFVLYIYAFTHGNIHNSNNIK